MKLFAKKVSAAEVDAYFRESQGQELLILDLLTKSRRTAWRIAGFGGVVSIFALSIALVAASRPAPDPRVLRVDNSTGAVTEVPTGIDGTQSQDEVRDIFMLNSYLLHRESYDYATLQIDYDAVQLLSSDAEWKKHEAYIDGPDGMLKIVKDAYKIIVKINSITPNTEARQAVVRFTTVKVYADNRKVVPENKIATVGYSYPNMLLTPKQRTINPWGFQVDSYRVDPEIVNPR